MGKTPAPFGTVLDRSYNDGTPVAKGDIVLWRQARYFVLAMNGSKKKEGLYVFPIEAVTLICPVASTSGVHYPLDKSVTLVAKYPATSGWERYLQWLHNFTTKLTDPKPTVKSESVPVSSSSLPAHREDTEESGNVEEIKNTQYYRSLSPKDQSKFLATFKKFESERI